MNISISCSRPIFIPVWSKKKAEKHTQYELITGASHLNLQYHSGEWQLFAPENQRPIGIFYWKYTGIDTLKQRLNEAFSPKSQTNIRLLKKAIAGFSDIICSDFTQAHIWLEYQAANIYIRPSENDSDEIPVEKIIQIHPSEQFRIKKYGRDIARIMKDHLWGFQSIYINGVLEVMPCNSHHQRIEARMLAEEWFPKTLSTYKKRSPCV